MNEEAKIKKEITFICKSMLEDKINLLKGAELIASYSSGLAPQHGYRDEVFNIFVAVDSESDHIPLEEDVRKRFDKKYLEKLDQEAKEIIDFYKDAMFSSCKEIISKYEKELNN